LLTHGRLCNVEPLGGTTEMQLLGDGYEISEMTKFHALLPTHSIRVASSGPGAGTPLRRF
jgi:hypothetical protein